MSFSVEQLQTVVTILISLMLIGGGFVSWLVAKHTQMHKEHTQILKEKYSSLEEKYKEILRKESNQITETPDPGTVIRKNGGSPSEFPVERSVAIGVDIGSSKIAVGAFDINTPGPITDDRISVEDVTRPASVDSLLMQVVGLIETHIRKEDIARKDLLGIGVAAPGQVNIRTGTLEFGPGLNVRGVPLKRELEEKLGNVTVRVDNDARCATRCELYFGKQYYKNFACVFIGTGVGSGIVINGQIYYGEFFCAGEIGHATLDPEGPECNCGRKGCLEAYVNGPAIVRRALAIAERYKKEGRQTRLHEFGHELNARHIALAFDEQDEVAEKTVREVARYLGIGLSNYINILNPGAIVLGGGVMQGFYNHMINDVKKVIQEHCLTQLINTPISQAKYMDYGAVLGAACLFRDDEKQGIEF